ncbi:energy-coupling factor transporter transmembrane protein EcfT [Striga asiatica]|uniref:Energy-coupling factor transporter transmembrane protein EcfT n=1 Tax=Striga asiatica TaxID=4170 RepID=A0A5A7NZZ5_STRAF|nr:energy-coupling factor transporter transmembrane protein EcfT [Striga asiatica]
MYPKLLIGHQNFLPISPSPLAFAPSAKPPLILRHCHSVKLRPRIRCTDSSNNGNGAAKNWEKWMPRNLFAAEKVFGAISGATSSPIAQYISNPVTFLHRVDPRIKMVWLLALVILPAGSNMKMRVAVVAYLTLLSIWVQPTAVWKDQLGRVTLICGILFVLLGLSTDSAPSLLRSRSPPSSLTGLPAPPTSFEGYKYVIVKFGPLQLTQLGLSAATTAACLTFTIFQSASLCLTTTTPEQLAFALQWFILPLASVGVPVAELILTLLLSIRFINLVLDEVRNVALGIVSRRIKWQQLTSLETIDVFFTYIRRIFSNIYSHAAQISQAMIVRGFRGDCDSHRVFLSAGSSDKIANIVASSCLVGLIFAATLPNYLHS